MGVAQQGSGTEAAQVLIVGGVVSACTLKSESLQNPERTRRNVHSARQAVVKVEIGKGIKFF